MASRNVLIDVDLRDVRSHGVHVREAWDERDTMKFKYVMPTIGLVISLACTSCATSNDDDFLVGRSNAMNKALSLIHI